MSRMEEHHGEHLWTGHSHLGAPTALPRSTRLMSNIYTPSMPLQANYSSVGAMGPRMGDRAGELPDQHTQPISPRHPSDLSFQYSQHSPIASSPISNQYPTNGYMSYPSSHLEQEFGHFSMPASALVQSPGSSTFLNDSTLFMDNLEAWMDEHYVRGACKFMGWTPIAVNVPITSSPETSASTPNNPGYCFVTFANPSQAAAALTSAQANSGTVMMPNSSRPFTLQWATRVSVSQLMQRQQVIASSAPTPSTRSSPEYSIFVGDLAPEATNADLVAVFRNPVLGLRQDRQPKIVAPFTSCKSAKIMLDPATNVSKGYGFVRLVSILFHSTS
jgi:RNA recognition motif-containing protein